MDLSLQAAALAAMALASLGLVPVAQAGVDGQWAIAVPGSSAGVRLELKSDGGRLTGSLSGPNGKMEIGNGSISGDAISFETAVKLDRQTITVFYKGQVEGDEIHLTVGAGEYGGGQRVTAKRLPANAAPPDWFSESPAPDEVVAWLKANAISLKSVQPGSGFDDMMPLKARLKDARVVAMGEATHGTREFFQFKHRMFEFLVEELGFTVFGMEANWPESLEVNAYVLEGKGDAREAVGRLAFAVWQTEEVLDLIRWMRQYNLDAAHTQKLKFYGFDMQAQRGAESNVLAYLRRVDPEYRAAAAQTFAVLGEYPNNQAYIDGPAEIRRRTAESLAAILRRFDERKPEYIARTGQSEWAMARQNMVVVKQAEAKMANPGEPGRAYRDQAMAENVKWIMDQEPAGTKMMLWAHDNHIAGDAEAHPPMGAHLRRIFGEQVALCGFLFQQGSFRAIDMTTHAATIYTVGPPPEGSLDATFAAAGVPLFAADLRHLPGGKVADWFAAPHVSRQIGAGYSEATPGIWLQRTRAARAFDVLIFVGKTTASRPL